MMIVMFTLMKNIVEVELLYVVMSSEDNVGIKDKLSQRFSSDIGFDDITVYIESFVPFMIGV